MTKLAPEWVGTNHTVIKAQHATAGLRRPPGMYYGMHFSNQNNLIIIVVCWSLTSLCHSNGHIETMPAREINPFTALTRIRSQFRNHSEWTRLRIRPLSHRGWLDYNSTR